MSNILLQLRAIIYARGKFRKMTILAGNRIAKSRVLKYLYSNMSIYLSLNEYLNDAVI